MPVDIPAILRRHASARAGRSTWESHWQRLAEVLLPRAADFTSEHTPGDRRMTGIYDGHPMAVRRELVASIDSMLKPKTSRWFDIKVKGLEDDEIDDDAKRWLEAARDCLWTHLYARRAQFIAASGQVDDELITFGTGCLHIGERADKSGLCFRSIPLRDVVIYEDADGVVDAVMVSMALSARQAARKWGEDALSGRVREALRDKPDEVGRYLWAVQPRDGADPSRLDAKGMAFESVVIDIKAEHVVSESGYAEFPFAVPRWDRAAGEVYGRSPGMVALPDVNTLQSMGKTMLKAGQLAVEPPLVTPADGIVGGKVRLVPGGLIPVDYAALRSSGVSQPVYPLSLGENLPLSREMQSDVRLQVERAFFRNVLSLPVDGPSMTATEVIERKQAFIREMGPIFGKLEADYTGALAERAWAVLMRGGAFGPVERIPESLRGREIRFEFNSPLTQALRKVEMTSLQEAITAISPLASVRPDMLDHLDSDAIMRALPDGYGFPGALPAPVRGRGRRPPIPRRGAGATTASRRRRPTRRHGRGGGAGGQGHRAGRSAQRGVNGQRAMGRGLMRDLLLRLFRRSPATLPPCAVMPELQPPPAGWTETDRARAYRRAFLGTPSGHHVLWDLLSRLGLQGPVFGADFDATRAAFQDGRRDAAALILRELFKPLPAPGDDQSDN